MKKTTRIILYAVIGTAVSMLFLLMNVPIHLAILSGLGYFSFFYLLGELIVLAKRYKRAEYRAYNKAQGIPALIGTILVVMVNVVTSMSFFLVHDGSFNVIINMALIIIVAFLSSISFRNALVYIDNGYLHADKVVPLTNIIRYTAFKNKKGVYKQMTVDYYTDDTKQKTATVFTSYSKSFEEILDKNLSKKKRGY